MGTPNTNEPMHAEVLANLLRQPLGAPSPPSIAPARPASPAPPTLPGPPLSVADLCVPPSLLSRIADRVMLSSFHDSFRQVISNGPTTRAEVVASVLQNWEGDPGGPAALLTWLEQQVPVPASITLIPTTLSPDDPLLRWAEARPAARGFRPAIHQDDPPSAGPGLRFESEPEASAAACIAHRLASDGLLRTLAHALAHLGVDTSTGTSHDRLAQLARLGFPVDLLASVTGGAPSAADSSTTCPDRARAVVEQVEGCVRASGAADADLRGFVFRHLPTGDRFAPDVDAGQLAPALLRLQLTRGGHWIGPGSGDNLDLVCAILRILPDVPVLASVQSTHLPALVNAIASRRLAELRPITIAVERSPVSQWARDNAWPGAISPEPPSTPDPDSRPGLKKRAALLPRFPSRGDDGSVFVPGEHAPLRSLRACGIEPVHSPLLFQGGNLLLVPDPLAANPGPGPAPRLLLIGEAEIARNVALGLTPSEAADALRIEFRADKAAVLPGVSYHIDYEISLRAITREASAPQTILAFVNDSGAAVRTILACGVERLESRHALPKSRAKAARQCLSSERWRELAELLYSAVLQPALITTRDRLGFRESLAAHFSDAPEDNGVGNLHVFVHAVDVLATWQPPSDENALSPPALAVLRAVRRRAADRASLHNMLKELGFVLVPVPSMSDAQRGINYLNGVHLPGHYLCPTWGGMYTPLDAQATAIFRRELGADVAVAAIPSAESQRRSGSVHCSTCFFAV